MKLLRILLLISFLSVYKLIPPVQAQSGGTGMWMKYETTFESTRPYKNPLYDLQRFAVRFTAPSGKVKTINGFWDGGQTWRVRFAPDEPGTWTYQSSCSDTTNLGLHARKGTFSCVAAQSNHAIYTKGGIVHSKGSYHLSHADGTPFFFTACTAWNGALKSTDAEWDTYLKDRAANHYNVIQFVSTQWRGCTANSQGQVAFEGSGRITLNPVFFQQLDKKIDAINQHGLVAAPVLLWALPVAEGRELSPGYYLPEQEAALLAKYLVARYGGHQVIWILGGDGKYVGEYEQRWKNIGRAVFGAEHPGTVALHPQGQYWIGKEYAMEEWLDIVGYQTGHDSRPSTLSWITSGPVAREWTKLPPKVLINMEPCYEEISPNVTAKDVRNASYWSVFSAPVAGITYGANGIWPWIRPGETIQNHGEPEPVNPWYDEIKLPGSKQIGYLSHFISQYDWSQLKPAPDLLIDQPGRTTPAQFVSVVSSDDHRTILVYVPAQSPVKLLNPGNAAYQAQWYNPVTDQRADAQLTTGPGTLEAALDGEGDRVLVLTLKKEERSGKKAERSGKSKSVR